MSALKVRAKWDEEAGVWVAESEDVPGLVAEAETFEDLLSELHTLIPELLALNKAAAPGGEVPVDIIAKRQERIRSAA